MSSSLAYHNQQDSGYRVIGVNRGSFNGPALSDSVRSDSWGEIIVCFGDTQRENNGIDQTREVQTQSAAIGFLPSSFDSKVNSPMQIGALMSTGNLARITLVGVVGPNFRSQTWIALGDTIANQKTLAVAYTFQNWYQFGQYENNSITDFLGAYPRSAAIADWKSELTDRHWQKNEVSSEVREKSDIVGSLKSEFHLAKIDDDSIVDAQLAFHEALSYVERELVGFLPKIRVTSDGVITLDWRVKESGVLLMFAGDNTVSCSLKRPGQLYSMSDISVPLSDPLPQDIRFAIKSLESEKG